MRVAEGTSQRNPGTGILLPSCSVILSGCFLSSWSQSSCCGSKHHICIPGLKRKGGRTKKACQMSLTLFIRENCGFLRSPTPKF